MLTKAWRDPRHPGQSVAFNSRVARKAIPSCIMRAWRAASSSGPFTMTCLRAAKMKLAVPHHVVALGARGHPEKLRRETYSLGVLAGHESKRPNDLVVGQRQRWTKLTL